MLAGVLVSCGTTPSDNGGSTASTPNSTEPSVTPIDSESIPPLLSVSEQVPANKAGVVISEVYGGGGNNGGAYTNDFIELYNNCDTDVNLAGWSLWYASAKGKPFSQTDSYNNINSTKLTGTIKAKGYFLVQQAAGSKAVKDLPTPDVIGEMALSSSKYKVMLTNSTTIPNMNLSEPTYVDFVGAGEADLYEGAAAAPAAANATSLNRALVNGKMVDTDNNGADFTLAAPTPKNSKN